MTTKKLLNILIDEFLAVRRESDGGYAPVTEKDLEQLDTIIYKLIGMKWAMDPDGDLPIDFKIIDRTRFEPMHYDPVPYQHKTEDDPLAQRGRLAILMMNAHIALEALDTQMRIEWHKKRKQA